MVDVRNRDEFRPWLKTQDRDVCIAIAARCALRVLPLTPLKQKIRRRSKQQQWPDAHTLGVFWANSVALSASLWPLDLSLREAAKSAADAAAAAGAADAAAGAAAGAAAYAGAAYAAYAADAAYDDSNFKDDATSVYNALQSDVNHMLAGREMATFLTRPLWHVGDVPAVYKKNWDTLKSDLKGKDPNWSVWTDWYDALLQGNAPFIKAIEIGDPENGQFGRCTFPKEFYKDPPRLNAALRAVIDNHWAKARQTIPPKKPASIRPVFKNGRLALNHTPLDPDLEAAIAAANLQSIRNEMQDLAEDVRLRGNVNADPAVHLERTAKLIPDGIPDALILFGLVRKEAILMECLAMINDQWPDGLAAHYRANCSELSKALDMFLDRRTARRQSIKSELEDQDLDAVMLDMKEQTENLRDKSSLDIIDIEVSDALDGIADEYSEATSEVSKAIIATDMVESQNNLLKTLAEEGLKPENFQGMNMAIRNAYAQALPQGIIEGAAEGGLEDGKKIGKAIARANAGKEAGLALSDKYPKIFGWMKNLFD